MAEQSDKVKGQHAHSIELSTTKNYINIIWNIVYINRTRKKITSLKYGSIMRAML